MTADRYQALLELVRNRAGGALRGAVRYDPEGSTVLYLRDDVATEQLRDSLDALVDRARAAEPVVPERAYDRLGET